MRLCYILFLVVFLKIPSLAQDQIIMKSGDTVECSIKSINNKYISFTALKNGKAIESVLARRDVSKYRFGHSPDNNFLKVNDFPKVRLAFNIGYSYMTGEIESGLPVFLDDYYRNLKSGYHYGFEAGYFFNENIGVGVEYDIFRTENSIDDIIIEYEDGTTEHGTMSDDITDELIGVALLMRIPNDNFTSQWFGSIFIGKHFYNNNARLIDEFRIFGDDVALAYEIGYEIVISSNLALGLNVSVVSAMLSEATIETGRNSATRQKIDEESNISRIEASVGLRFIR